MLLIIIGIVLFFGSYFSVTYTTSYDWILSAVAIILLALPSFVSFVKSVKRGVLALVVLSIFALIIENLAVMSGFPYGQFEYGRTLGGLIGDVPWTVAFAWTPLVIGSLALAQQFTMRYAYVLGVGFLVLADLVLDPGAVALGYWTFVHNGLYYGVPLSNYLGWIFSGAFGLALLRFFVGFQLPKNVITSLFLIVMYWTGVNFWLGQWIPFVIGVLFTLLIVCVNQNLLVKLKFYT